MPTPTCLAAGPWAGHPAELAAAGYHGERAGQGERRRREELLTDNSTESRRGRQPRSADARSDSARDDSAGFNGGSGDLGGNATTQVRIVIPEEQSMLSLLGSGDELLRVIENAVKADFHVRGNEITITGPAAETAVASRLFDELTELVASGAPLSADSIEHSVSMLRRKTGARPAEVLNLDILSSRGRTIRPKTLNQKRYVDAIDNHTVVFAIGPAGTGKTYLAMAKAVKALQAKEVNRIILTRPAVEAGERLGFLPGTLYEKIDPYLRPLYDALHDMVDPDSIPRLMAAGTIEIAPLAYMRGRAQPVDTPVLTPEGFRPIGDLEIGDFVIGSAGEPVLVIGVYPQGEKDIYRVTAQDGASTLCSEDHLWSVMTHADRRRGREPRVLATKEMIGNLRASHYHRYELPLLSAPVCFPSQEVPMDPYAMGLLLGDGCPTSAAHVLSLAGAGSPAISQQPRAATTESLPDSVPMSYLFNSADIRLAILQGLLDSDGAPVARQGSECVISYATSSRQLSEDILFLVRSLGGVATASRADESQSDGAYSLDVRLPRGVQPFRLERKLAKYLDSGGGGRPMRFIEGIEPAGTAEAVCIAVAAADSLYTTEDFLLTHNTLNDSFIILDEAQNTSSEQMKMFLTRLGFGSRIVVTGDVTQIDLPSGQISGLRQIQDILDGVDDVYFSRLTSHDVVRHKLVADIVDAYARYDEKQAAADPGRLRTGQPRRDGYRSR
jgi:phosphate starvation-inducible protein PhoH and related proteins